MDAKAALSGRAAIPKDAPCPLRPGDACRTCVPGATGPHDCGLVYLVMSDPDLRAALRDERRGPAPARP